MFYTEQGALNEWSDLESNLELLGMVLPSVQRSAKVPFATSPVTVPRTMELTLLGPPQRAGLPSPSLSLSLSFSLSLSLYTSPSDSSVSASSIFLSVFFFLSLFLFLILSLYLILCLFLSPCCFLSNQILQCRFPGDSLCICGFHPALISNLASSQIPNILDLGIRPQSSVALPLWMCGLGPSSTAPPRPDVRPLLPSPRGGRAGQPGRPARAASGLPSQAVRQPAGQPAGESVGLLARPTQPVDQSARPPAGRQAKPADQP